MVEGARLELASKTAKEKYPNEATDDHLFRASFISQSVYAYAFSSRAGPLNFAAPLFCASRTKNRPLTHVEVNSSLQ